jgi:hypothetical protein
VRALVCALVLGGMLVAAAGAQTERPALRVTQEFVGSQLYMEGSIGYIQIKKRTGRVVASGTFREARELRFRLAPGRYRVVSFQRPCDGNCSYLDPPTDRCSRALVIRRRHPVAAKVEISPGNGCTIRLH